MPFCGRVSESLHGNAGRNGEKGGCRLGDVLSAGEGLLDNLDASRLHEGPFARATP